MSKKAKTFKIGIKNGRKRNKKLKEDGKTGQDLTNASKTFHFRGFKLF